MALKDSDKFFPTAAKSADAAGTRAIFDALIQPLSEFAEKMGCDKVGTSGKHTNGTRGLPFRLKDRWEDLFKLWVERSSDKQHGLAAIEFNPIRIAEHLRPEFEKLHDELLKQHGQSVVQNGNYGLAIGFTTPEAGLKILEGLRNFVVPAVERYGVGAFAPYNRVQTEKPAKARSESATVDPKMWAQIAQRRGQPKFRKALLRAYGNQCAITGCNAGQALEAAHITPYSEDASYDVQHGILLRADIHTLFDLHLISVHPEDYRICIAPSLHESYGELRGQLKIPKRPSARPDKQRLHDHYQKWSQRCSA